MGRGIVHRKVQTNRAREMGADDHQVAGIGALALSSLHRDNPDTVRDMLTAPVKAPQREMVTIPRDVLDELVTRVTALENASRVAPISPDSVQVPVLAATSEQTVP